MKVVDGRGKNKKAVSKANREKVRAWFLKNPGDYISSCCHGTGLTYKTVKKHILAIQSGDK